MITIVIANGHILVDSKMYVPLDWVAYSENDEIGIHHVNNFERCLFKGRVAPSAISLNGTTYATAFEFVYAFNALTIAALSYLLTSMKSNTDYPDGFFSQNTGVSSTVPARVVPLWCITGQNGGYVVLTTPSTNTGNIYIGESDVSNASNALGPDKSITLELSDLSLIWVLAEVEGELLNIIGAAKT